MIPLPLLQQLEDQDQPFVLTRIPNMPRHLTWVCRIGSEDANAVRGYGHSASEALSEALTKFNVKSAPAIPSDLNHSWCLP